MARAKAAKVDPYRQKKSDALSAYLISIAKSEDVPKEEAADFFFRNETALAEWTDDDKTISLVHEFLSELEGKDDYRREYYGRVASLM